MATQTDPVCGMDVDTSNARFSLEYDGQMYYFCSRGCMLEFQDDPHKYLDPKYEPEGM